MRILVTGGTGFIGSHITNHLTNEGHEVIVVGTKTEQHPKAARYLSMGLDARSYDFMRVLATSTCVSTWLPTMTRSISTKTK